MALVSRDQLKAAKQRRKTVDVPLPAFGEGVEVRLRALSAGEALQFNREVTAAQEKGEDVEARALYMIARSWVDEEGEPLFPEEEGVEVLRGLSTEDYNALAKAVLKLNGMGAQAVEEAAKN